jgi:hypothetical protein
MGSFLLLFAPSSPLLRRILPFLYSYILQISARLLIHKLSAILFSSGESKQKFALPFAHFENPFQLFLWPLVALFLLPTLYVFGLFCVFMV